LIQLGDQRRKWPCGKQDTADSLYDECVQIADNAKREDWAIARLRIETRMRAAGALDQ
jgi:hypothetical protein